MRRLVIAVAALVLAAPMARAAGLTGNEACAAAECHPKLYEAWKKSAHGKSFDLLKPNVRAKEKQMAGLKPAEDYTADKSCMKCHVTGWQEGGYSFEKPDGKWKGVGCEACHGAAAAWNELHTNKNLQHRERKLKQAGLMEPFKGVTVCERCHRDVNSPYKDRHEDRDWTEEKWTGTYHPLP